MEQNYNDEIEIDLAELFFVLLGEWKRIVLSAVLAAAVVFAYCKLLAVPQYESTAKLYVLSKSTSITSLADVQLGSSLTQDYMEVVNSRPVLEEVIEDLGLEDNYEELRDRLTVENKDNTRILAITVRDPDPEQAKKIVDRVAKASAGFIAERMDQDAPNVFENGYANKQKVSPATAKDTAIGGLIGGVLAVAIVTILHLMNDTIMTSDDMEKYLGINVLASIPLEGGEKKDRNKAGIKNIKKMSLKKSDVKKADVRKKKKLPDSSKKKK